MFFLSPENILWKITIPDPSLPASQAFLHKMEYDVLLHIVQRPTPAHHKWQMPNYNL